MGLIFGTSISSFQTQHIPFCCKIQQQVCSTRIFRINTSCQLPANPFSCLNNFCVEFLSNFFGTLQFLSSLIKIIPYFYYICFSFTLSRIELTFCHSDHKVILRWGCFRRSNIIAFENLSQISKMVLIFLGQRSNPAGFICMPLHLTEIFKSLLIHHQTPFYYKKLGRRRNAAPYKNYKSFFDAETIIYTLSLKINPHSLTFQKMWYD